MSTDRSQIQGVTSMWKKSCDDSSDERSAYCATYLEKEVVHGSRPTQQGLE
jgi:hypothetical protein